jgi:endonuclease/exonuclease/phosphatase family metal-dependent hydrolase
VFGYNCVERAAQGEGKERKASGLALLASKALPFHEVGAHSPHQVLGKVSVPGVTAGITVGTVYVPPTKVHQGARKAVLKNLANAVAKVLEQNADAEVLIMGDFNMKRKQLQRWLIREKLPLGAVPVTGYQMTYRSGKRRTAIDHAIATWPAIRRGAVVRVGSTWDRSDHFPIICELPLAATSGDEGVERRSRRVVLKGQVKACAWEIAQHNYWDPLIEQLGEDECDVSEAAEVMREVSWNVLATQKAMDAREVGTREGQYPIRAKTRKAINHRRNLMAKIEKGRRTQELTEVQAGILEAQYKVELARTKRMCRADRREFWLKCVKASVTQLKTGNPAGYWRWIKSTMGSGHSGAGSAACQPVVDPTKGSLVTDRVEIGQAWAGHYARLAADTGRPSDKAHWAAVGRTLPKLGELPGLNDLPSWDEVRQVIKSMHNNKAPGRDGIPIEVYKTELEAERMVETGVMDAIDQVVAGPASKIGSVLLMIVRQCWLQKTVPKMWETANVVSIPKKGCDPTNMDSYRGISLIPVALKVLCTILARRISNALESSGRLCKEQGGFRPREECMAQVVALYEVLWRRHQEGEVTYVTFFDFVKAYDKVIHAALFYKMECIGVRGQILEFVRELYAHSNIVVTGSFGESPVVPLLTGLRQGCPMSPVLFDIFINDLASELEGLGVEVPQAGGAEISSLLLADDVASLTANTDNTHEAVDAVAKWGDNWGMVGGAKKCGIMMVGGEEADLPEAHGPWTIHGGNIPLVMDYQYLGCKLHVGLSLDVTCADRRSKGVAALAAMRPFLRLRSIPIATKVLVVKSVLRSSMLYGAELWGMSGNRVDKSNKAMNRALRLCIAGPFESSGGISLIALREELDVPSIQAASAAARARAFFKYPQLKTWAADLVQNPSRVRGNAWTSGTIRWMNRWGPKVVVVQEAVDEALAEGALKGHVVCPGRVAHEIVQKHVWDRERAKSAATSWKDYQLAGYVKTRSWVQQAAYWPEFTNGAVELIRCRVGCFTTVTKLAKWGKVHSKYGGMCPFCNANRPETVSHMLVECSAWDSDRQSLIGQLIAQAEGSMARRGDNDRVDASSTAIALLGGGEGSRYLPGWVKHQGLSTPGAEPTTESGEAVAQDGTQDSNSEGSEPSTGTTARCDPHRTGSADPVRADSGGPPGCVRVAAFLQAVRVKRLARLDRLDKPGQEPPRADAPSGVGQGVDAPSDLALAD